MEEESHTLLYLYQTNDRFFAQMAEELKEMAAEELQSLGATDTREVYRGLHFGATPKVLYKINYHARLINRVLAPLLTFKCHSDQYLYRKALQIPWTDFMDPSSTFAVFATVSHSAIRHSQFAALRLKDAVVDFFRQQTGQRPSIDRRNPDVWLNLHIQNNEATISLDTSGGSLHRRGYRVGSVTAPMAETVAAAIIRYSGWDGSVPLYDPFCGSGTLLCEAYMHAANMPAAMLRKKFGFERLPDFDARVWQAVRKEGLEGIALLPPGLISGSDASAEAVNTARKNCAKITKSEATIRIEQKAAFKLDRLRGKTIVCNPPYGIRMNKQPDLPHFYENLGNFLKQRCSGSTAFIYFGERKYLKNIGLRASWKKPLTNGGLDGRLAKYDLY